MKKVLKKIGMGAAYTLVFVVGLTIVDTFITEEISGQSVNSTDAATMIRRLSKEQYYLRESVRVLEQQLEGSASTINSKEEVAERLEEIKGNFKRLQNEKENKLKEVESQLENAQRQYKELRQTTSEHQERKVELQRRLDELEG